MNKPYLGKKKPLGLLNESEFFELLSAASGYLDPETVRRVYNGMLQVIYTELRSKGAVRLPALCDFHLLLSRPKRIKNHRMENSIVKPASHQVRIRPVGAVRAYFKALDEHLQGAVLDPAEKVKKGNV